MLAFPGKKKTRKRSVDSHFDIIPDFRCSFSVYSCRIKKGKEQYFSGALCLIGILTRSQSSLCCAWARLSPLPTDLRSHFTWHSGPGHACFITMWLFVLMFSVTEKHSSSRITDVNVRVASHPMLVQLNEGTVWSDQNNQTNWALRVKCAPARYGSPSVSTPVFILSLWMRIKENQTSLLIIIKLLLTHILRWFKSGMEFLEFRGKATFAWSRVIS